jgi:diguanylate cyclase (GGDEF)-like protein
MSEAAMESAATIESPAVPASASGGRGLRAALLDSRHRWRDLATMGADLAFETDAWDRFVFLYPDTLLGWNAATLLGQPAGLLLADPAEGGGSPFRPTTAVRHRRAWLKSADGALRCLSFAAAPLLDDAGRIVGARGIAQDMTEQDGFDAGVATALRRSEVIDQILWRMRQEVLAPRMMQAALDALTTALGAEGCILVDLLGDGAHATMLHQLGAPPPQVLHAALTLLEACDGEPAFASAPDGRSVLVCPSQTRFGEQAGLALWRLPGGRAWDADDERLVAAATGIIRVILEHESIQREMARQARTDPLTGLLNRRAFMEEIGRRIDRLERDGRPGTLLFVDLDQFKALNDAAGHDLGDEALVLVAALLRATVRPADLVARLGGDEFALWLDGADELAAAERAEQLRIATPGALAETAEGTGLVLGMSIGIATLWPGRGEALEDIITRADQAMYHVKRNGRGQWHVSWPERRA